MRVHEVAASCGSRTEGSFVASVRDAVKYLALFAALTACATEDVTPIQPGPDEDPGADELNIGDYPDDMKADENGTWGHALECKPIPNLTPLVAPKITLSIDGLTLHLTDAVTGFNKVYPVGPGKVETDPTSGEYRESYSYYPVASTGRSDFKITPSTIQTCKTWWTDPDTGARSPVFGGLPFLSFYGNYAIHGPIDNYRAPNGGNLRRGYVSHGCFRMEAADIVEVYALIKGVANVPVHLQREAEKTTEGARVNIPAKWIGAQCAADADCNFPNGFCHTNPLTERGFCSARCTATCSDRAGQPTTFCVADAAAPGKGMCVAKAPAENFECRPYDHLAPTAVTRFNNPAVTATACLPKSPGWVGDHCLANTDCGSGTTCRGATATKPGICSMACEKFCSDQPGYADTFCVGMPSLATGGSCLRQCTPSSNAAECPSNSTCTAMGRYSAFSVGSAVTTMKYVCQPN